MLVFIASSIKMYWAKCTQIRKNMKYTCFKMELGPLFICNKILALSWKHKVFFILDPCVQEKQNLHLQIFTGILIRVSFHVCASVPDLLAYGCLFCRRLALVIPTENTHYLKYNSEKAFSLSKVENETEAYEIKNSKTGKCHYFDFYCNVRKLLTAFY